MAARVAYVDCVACVAVVIGMAARAGMLFAALSLAKTSPHRRPVKMLLVRVLLRE
jgi:hypothetical protein